MRRNSISILLVEDDLHLGSGIERSLKTEGYATVWAKNLDEAKVAFEAQTPKMVLLDWMLPNGAQGIDFLRMLRERRHDIPVLMLSARTEVVDKVVALELGANDYLVKPFDVRELLARVRVHLRENSRAFDSPKTVSTHRALLNLSERRAFRREGNENREIELTKMEYELLHAFMLCPNRLFSREELLNRVWGYHHTPTTRTVDTHILQLRQKFGEEIFETVRGVGYRMKD